MPKRKSKKYERPKNLFDKTRIEEENRLKEKYGLKNKREIWKADARIRKIRNLAKELITKSEEEKQAFIIGLQKIGFDVNNIADALALNKEDWLKRRLQTVVFTKGLVRTPKQARQLVVHKHISIGNKIINIPSYMVKLDEEPEVKLNIVLKTPKGKTKIEEIKKDIEESKIVKAKQEAEEKITQEIEKSMEVSA